MAQSSSSATSRLANPQCIADLALTSEGGIVVLGCDGTLYGVSD